MEQNIDKSKEQTKPQITIESSISEPITVGKAKAKEEIVDDELDLDLELEDEEEVDETESDEITEDEVEEEVEEKPKPKAKAETKLSSRERNQLRILKVEADKKNAEIADLKNKLAEKENASKVSETVSKYLEEGYDEKEAKAKARDEIKQSTIEKQLEVLMFEKKNRRILEQYPNADDDLEKIMLATKSGVMTVEQVCRGLYGAGLSDKEKRVIKSLTDEGNVSDNSVSKSIRTANVPKKSSLTQEQLRLKRELEKMVNKGKPMTDEEFLKNYPF